MHGNNRFQKELANIVRMKTVKLRPDPVCKLRISLIENKKFFNIFLTVTKTLFAVTRTRGLCV